MTDDQEGLYGRSLLFDAEEWTQKYPELAPLAPVADALRLLNENDGPISVADEADNRLDVVRGLEDEPLSDRTEELRSELRWEALRKSQRATRLKAAAERVEAFGLKVDRETGRVTVPTGNRGPDPLLLTLAAGMVWNALPAQEGRQEAVQGHEVSQELASRVADRLFVALSWGWPDGGLDTGRNSRLRRALRRYVAEPDRYQWEHLVKASGASDD